MLDTLDENELVGTMMSEENHMDHVSYDDDISLAGPPSVVRVEGNGSLSSFVTTPSGRSSSRIPRSASRSASRVSTYVIFLYCHIVLYRESFGKFFFV